MAGRKYEKPLHLDMDFGEALERFGQTEVRELPENVKLKKQGQRAKKPASPKPKKR